jgi:hypothetical protein
MQDLTATQRKHQHCVTSDPAYMAAMNLPNLLSRNLLLFGYAMAFWLLLIILDVTLQFNGVVAGLLYWVSLIILFTALWYVNMPVVSSIQNEMLRFGGIVLLTTLITIIFMFLGIALSMQFKSLIGG